MELYKQVQQLEYELECYQKLYEDISEELSLSDVELWDRIHDRLIKFEEKVDTNKIK